MVPQVKVVSILMIVYGALVGLSGILSAGLGSTLGAVTAFGNYNPPSGPTMNPTITIVLTISTGVVLLIIGVLHVVAGIRTLKFQNRVLAIVTLFTNPLLMLGSCLVIHCASLFTCIPLGAGMMIYGLIVFFNDDVAKAFALAAEGVSPEEILLEFKPAARPSRRGRRRRSEEDEYLEDRDDDRRREEPPPPRPQKPDDNPFHFR